MIRFQFENLARVIVVWKIGAGAAMTAANFFSAVLQ